MTVGLSGRRVLVTGANGFLGSHLLARLVATGAQMDGVSRSSSAGRSADVRWWQLDLGDAHATARMISLVRPEFVFHLAGQTTADRHIDLVLPVFRSNLQGTINLLTAVARIEPARVILAGSLEEPGALDADPVPSSPYAATKWASTGYARMFHDLWGLPVTALRVSMAYGPGQRDMSKLIPYVISSLLEGRMPKLTSGTRKVDWVYVDDVVEAFVAAARSPGAAGAVMDIGSGSSVSIRATVDLVKQIMSPGLEVKFGACQDRPRDTGRLADISVARQLIGWEPSTDLQQGLGQTIRWYQDSLHNGTL